MLSFDGAGEKLRFLEYQEVKGDDLSSRQCLMVHNIVYCAKCQRTKLRSSEWLIYAAIASADCQYYYMRVQKLIILKLKVCY